MMGCWLFLLVWISFVSVVLRLVGMPTGSPLILGLKFIGFLHFLCQGRLSLGYGVRPLMYWSPGYGVLMWGVRFLVIIQYLHVSVPVLFQCLIGNLYL